MASAAPLPQPTLARSGPLPTRGHYAYEVKELVVFDSSGAPDFPLVCERMLMRRRQIHVVYVIFDVLSLEGVSLLRAPYSERRAQLEALNLNGPCWRTPEAFEDGEALFEAVCERELEGVVAKRTDSRYRPGERGWIKIKNRNYWRYELERESAINKRRPRIFV